MKMTEISVTSAVTREIRELPMATTVADRTTACGCGGEACACGCGCCGAEERSDRERT